jgi:type VI secretion system protein ImpK
MRDHAANLVHSVLDYGLSLRDRLEGGAPLHFDDEQAAIKKMLLMDTEPNSWAEHGKTSSAGNPSPEMGEATLYGVRYVLTCWLDELFTKHSSWATLWAQSKLEASLYSTNDGAWKFWQHAQQAEADLDSDALEACYLCVMLGFRGNLAEQPDKLRNWIATTQDTLARHRHAWQPPPALEPPTHVPPLKGRERLQRMVLVSGMTALVLVPFVVFFLARQF